jgi:hypothetical protein
MISMVHVATWLCLASDNRFPLSSPFMISSTIPSSQEIVQTPNYHASASWSDLSPLSESSSELIVSVSTGSSGQDPATPDSLSFRIDSPPEALTNSDSSTFGQSALLPQSMPYSQTEQWINSLSLKGSSLFFSTPIFDTDRGIRSSMGNPISAGAWVGISILVLLFCSVLPIMILRVNPDRSLDMSSSSTNELSLERTFQSDMSCGSVNDNRPITSWEFHPECDVIADNPISSDCDSEANWMVFDATDQEE